MLVKPYCKDSSGTPHPLQERRRIRLLTELSAVHIRLVPRPREVLQGRRVDVAEHRRAVRRNRLGERPRVPPPPLDLPGEPPARRHGRPPPLLAAPEGGEPGVRAVRALPDGELKKECLLPSLIGELIDRGELSVSVLRSSARWFGMTYHEDKEMVQRELQKLHDAGVYPKTLRA